MSSLGALSQLSSFLEDRSTSSPSRGAGHSWGSLLLALLGALLSSGSSILGTLLEASDGIGVSTLPSGSLSPLAMLYSLKKPTS